MIEATDRREVSRDRWRRLLSVVVASMLVGGVAATCASVWPGRHQVGGQDLPWLKMRAWAGDDEARWEIGARLQEGRGVERNGAEARHWLLSALYRDRDRALAGDPQAALGVGLLLHTRLTVTYADEALIWYQRAAAGEAVGGQAAVVSLLEDYPELLDKEARLARLKHDATQPGPQQALAAQALGAVYEFGHGVPTDLQEARSWYGLGSELGNEYSTHCLARLP